MTLRNETLEGETVKGLPGLRPIREALKLTRLELSGQGTDDPICCEDTIRHVETGWSDTSAAKQRRLASILCCSVADLFTTPTPARLAEIRAAYLRRQADHAEAEAARMAEEQGAA